MNLLTYGSVCSGIESASVAWEPLGWRPAWFAEIEPFPCSVLAHHWPDVPNLGDMTTIAARVRTGEIPVPDVLVGGTPCQAFSVAGARAGLSDPRGQLTLSYVELADAIDAVRAVRGQSPVITVWENVPGVLSSKDNAFGCFLGALAGESCELQPPGGKWKNAGCVYGPQRAVAWRVLDAQYFGLAQRRRRVFVVASARDGFDPTAVLFEREGVRRDTPPSREAGQEPAGTLAARTEGGGFPGTDEACSGYVQPVARAVALRGRDGGATAELGGEVAGCLRASSGGGDKPHVLAFQPGNLARGAGSGPSLDVFPTLKADHGRGMSDQDPHVMVGSAVRRLTPRECERLQGFPDDWTLIPWRNKPADECPDGPRYKAIGNSKAVPVVRWLGRRIAAVVVS